MVRKAYNYTYGLIVTLDLSVDAKILWEYVIGLKNTTEKRIFNRLVYYEESLRSNTDYECLVVPLLGKPNKCTD